MRNLGSVSLSAIAALGILLATPVALRAEDAKLAEDAASAKKTKKEKRRSETAAVAPTAQSSASGGADTSGMSPEQIIDLYTSGKGGSSGSGSASSGSSPTPRPQDFGPAPDSTPGSAALDSIPAAPPSDMPPSDMGTAPSSSTDTDNNDGTEITTENSIPPNTLRAGELNNQAVDALNAKDYDKAIILLRQALVLDPNYQQGRKNLRVAYFNQGVDLYNDGKYADAIPVLEKAVALNKQLGDEPQITDLLKECREALKSNAK